MLEEGGVVRRKPNSTPCVCLSALGLAVGLEAASHGSPGVPGPPPRSSRKALREELGSRSSMSLYCPSAALYSLSSASLLEDEKKSSSYLHNVISMCVHHQDPHNVTLGILKLSHITCGIVVNSKFPIGLDMGRLPRNMMFWKVFFIGCK